MYLLTHCPHHLWAFFPNVLAFWLFRVTSPRSRLRRACMDSQNGSKTNTEGAPSILYSHACPQQITALLLLLGVRWHSSEIDSSRILDIAPESIDPAGTGYRLATESEACIVIPILASLHVACRLEEVGHQVGDQLLDCLPRNNFPFPRRDKSAPIPAGSSCGQDSGGGAVARS
ncbi:hypothetical protein BDZ85DRAFT_259665 [Elsinoe ampelina]|uniref:Uncharacterized protein n=1 Tax=Elsinoe ampelina TaxID=302913 RepID=A0A6A6GHF2_9PEZI|nr:hypothetical protein BDZ85DRAFT_259665 [Elsinoe ampelina]